MTSETHPEFETLLLWQSGELDPEHAREVQRHVAKCPACKDTLGGLEDLYSEGDWASSLVAQQSLRAHMAAQRSSFGWVRNRWSGAVAAILIAAMVLYSVTDLTPAARAESLLSHAAERELKTPFSPHTLRVSAGNRRCDLAFAVRNIPSLSTASSEGAVCRDINHQLHAIGLSLETALSAKSFEQWRSSLSRKHDAIHKTVDFTEVSTQTDDGPIHEATLRLRNADYEAVGARLQLVSDAGNSQIEIEKTPYAAPVEIVSAPPELHTSPAGGTARVPSLSALDRSEAEVWLALHRIGADTNILVAADRQPDVIRVWGLAQTAESKASIVQSLGGIPDVSLAVMTPTEQRAAQAPLPWQGSHGAAPPLAYDEVNDLFKDRAEDRQRFLNDLDEITRRLLGEARAREVLSRLARQSQGSEYAEPLRRGEADLERKLLSDQRELIARLEPIYAAFGRPTPKTTAALNFSQARQLYLLVHELFISSDSGVSRNAELALGKLEKLPL